MFKDKRPQALKGKVVGKPKRGGDGNTPKLIKSNSGMQTGRSPTSLKVDAETEMWETREKVDSEAHHQTIHHSSKSIQIESVKTAEAEMQTLKEDEMLMENVPPLFRTNHELLDLDDEIRSRKRTLELLDVRLPDFDEEVKEQIKIRDIRIEVLHHQNVTLRSLIKEKNQALSSNRLRTTLKECEEELADTKNAKFDLEQRLQADSEKFASKVQELENEIEATVSLNEALNEEVEGLKAQVQIKEKQSTDFKNDIKKLSEIIKDMSEVNSQLNKKIGVINTDMLNLAQKYHEVAAKAEHLDEVEELLKVISNEASEYQKKNMKLERTVEGLKSIFAELETCSREVCTKLGDLTNVVVGMAATLAGNDPSKAQTIKGLAQRINDLRVLLQTKIPEQGTTDGKIVQFDELATKIIELECEIKAKDSLIYKLSVQEQDLRKRIEGINEENARATKTWNEITEKSKKQLAELQSKLDHFITSLNNLRDDISKLKVVHARTTSELESKTNSGEELKHKLAEAKSQLSDVDSRLKQVFSVYKKSQEVAKSKEETLKAAEMKANRILNGFGVMQEEVFKRENEYLSCERVILQLQNEIEEANKRYAVLQASVKKIVARELESSNAMLEQKDREVTLLKEMIRSSHVEIKGKDTTIQKYKVKYKEQSSTAPAKALSQRYIDLPNPLSSP